MKNLLLFIFLLLNNSNVFSQDFTGSYFGELLVERNLMIIGEIKGKFIVELYSSEKDVFKIDGTLIEDRLNFQLPLNDGTDLDIWAELKDNSINLTFDLPEGKFSTDFSKINLESKNPVNTFFNKNEIGLDPSLFGRWMYVKLIDEEGNEIKDNGFSDKKYVTTFLKDGVFLLDPKFFRDLDKKSGIKTDFNYQNLPTGIWKTENQNILIETVGQYESNSVYEISNDTLRVVSKNGNTKIYIKVK